LSNGWLAIRLIVTRLKQSGMRKTLTDLLTRRKNVRGIIFAAYCTSNAYFIWFMHGLVQPI